MNWKCGSSIIGIFLAGSLAILSNPVLVFAEDIQPKLKPIGPMKPMVSTTFKVSEEQVLQANYTKATASVRTHLQNVTILQGQQEETAKELTQARKVLAAAKSDDEMSEQESIVSDLERQYQSQGADMQTQMENLQAAMQHQNQTYNLLSNILKQQYEAQKEIIRNMR